MEREDLREVDVGEGVAGDNEERAIEIPRELPDRSARAERRFHDGFSRNLEIRPSSPVITTPYSRGLGTCTSVRVTAAFRSRWNARTFERSMSVRASPEITRNVPSRFPASCRTDPPVPSGVSSTL